MSKNTNLRSLAAAFPSLLPVALCLLAFYSVYGWGPLHTRGGGVGEGEGEVVEKVQ